jgi:hypothetical protein
MRVSNLRRFSEALGGTLEITAHFAETTVVIDTIGAHREARTQRVTLHRRRLSGVRLPDPTPQRYFETCWSFT